MQLHGVWRRANRARAAPKRYKEPDMSIRMVTGVPGAGKTTVSEALAAQHPRAIHVPMDAFGDWSDAGHAADPWAHDAEHRNLSQRCAVLVATEYAAAGYVVVVDDTLEDERDD